MVLPDNGIVFSIFLIFAGSAVLATLALIARQAMIVAYILLGVVLGPWGLALVDDAAWINDVSDIGMMFLLYLLVTKKYRERFVKSPYLIDPVACFKMLQAWELYVQWVGTLLQNLVISFPILDELQQRVVL